MTCDHRWYEYSDSYTGSGSRGHWLCYKCPAQTSGDDPRSTIQRREDTERRLKEDKEYRAKMGELAEEAKMKIQKRQRALAKLTDEEKKLLGLRS
jgi:hypothetical protein